LREKLNESLDTVVKIKSGAELKENFKFLQVPKQNSKTNLTAASGDIRLRANQS